MKNGGMRAIDEMHADPCGVQGVLEDTRDARMEGRGTRGRMRKVEEYESYTKYQDEGGQRIQGEMRMKGMRERGSVRIRGGCDSAGS